MDHFAQATILRPTLCLKVVGMVSCKRNKRIVSVHYQEVSCLVEDTLSLPLANSKLVSSRRQKEADHSPDAVATDFPI